MAHAGAWLTLDRPAAYRITVPGEAHGVWPSWAAELTVTCETAADGQVVTTLAGTLDQAALHSVLRGLYALGVPLLAVTCMESQN